MTRETLTKITPLIIQKNQLEQELDVWLSPMAKENAVMFGSSWMAVTLWQDRFLPFRDEVVARIKAKIDKIDTEILSY